jgi:glycosyltransferase involved in cell wall biosynthesis
MATQPELAPRVSVIIPVFNGEQFLAEAIESVLAQSYASHEVIVVDDGSTDRTPQIAQSYASVKYVRQANSGTAAARNRGIEMARGEYLAFLDADDVWMADKLALQMAAFEADPSLEVVSGYVEQFIEAGQEDRYSVPAAPTAGYSTIAILMRRGVMDSVGLFHEEAVTGETINWFARFIDKQPRLLMLPQIVARRRIHGNNAGIRNQKEKQHNMIRTLKSSIERKRARPSTQDRP